MKKLISILLATLMIMSCFAVVSFAATTYGQPFTAGTAGSKSFRIPGLYTLNDGSVLASVDSRYNHATDSPQNLDTVIRVSKDGYDWSSEAMVINQFDDYAADAPIADSVNSASFIDPAIVQSKKTGRIFVLTDAFPSGCGSFAKTQAGTGHITVDGVKRLALTSGTDNTKDINTFEYYVGDFDDSGFAKVYNKADKTESVYTIDREYRLYKNGTLLTMKQNGSDITVAQNVFYDEAELTVFATMYQWLRTSDDNGKTWNAPTLITAQIKRESEGVLAIGPGRGFVTTFYNTERIIFTVYENSDSPTLQLERASTIFSDDGGKTWTRNTNRPSISDTLGIGKSSESQIVELPDGTLRMYSRSKSQWFAYTDSKDHGITWSSYKTDVNLQGTENCMMSFINYNSKKINGKSVILGSYASSFDGRANGVIRVGLVNDDNSIDWITTYRINDGFFAYSCLTELADGNIAALTEEGENGIVVYRVLSIDDNGKISEINGNDIPQEEPELGFFAKIKLWFQQLWNHILRTLGLI